MIIFSLTASAIIWMITFIFPEKRSRTSYPVSLQIEQFEVLIISSRLKIEDSSLVAQVTLCATQLNETNMWSPTWRPGPAVFPATAPGISGVFTTKNHKNLITSPGSEKGPSPVPGKFSVLRKLFNTWVPEKNF
jgi:hypothetical protein